MKRKHVIFIHILYWTYAFGCMGVLKELAYHKRFPSVNYFFGLISCSNYLIFGSFFYINYLFVLPRFYKKKRNYLLIIVSWILLAMVYVFVRYYVQEYLLLKYFGVCNYCGDATRLFVINNFYQAGSDIILTSAIIWFTINWITEERQKLELQKQKVEAERNFLQSQIGPHFMFNTLNNIYSMVFHHSPKSLEAIEQLSGIMRYMVEKSNTDLVSLETEINYLKNYIELQKYRSEASAVLFNMEGSGEGLSISPLMLISFIENSFTHGVINDTAHPVQISVSIESKKLHLKVSNKINTGRNDLSSGIGLLNIKKRLELLYPGNHYLHTQKNGIIFISELIIYHL